MLTLARCVYLLSLAVWLGTIVFFSFVVAPTVFSALPRAEAGQVVSAIFPIYYRVGYVCGAALLLTSLVLWRSARPASRRRVLGVALGAVMLALTAYAGVGVQPRAHALRTALHDPAAPARLKEEFDRLHRRAVQLNGAVLIGAVVLTVLTAMNTER
jgi:hypothetical protein